MKIIPIITDSELLRQTVVQLKTTKTTLKGKLTRQKTYIKSVTEAAAAVNLFDAQSRFDTLDGIFSSFCDVIDHLSAYTEVEGEKNGFQDELEVFEESFFELKGDFMKLLTPKEQKSKENVFVLKSESGENITFNQPQQAYRASLPEIKIPKFDGKIEHWIHFRELFDSIILKYEPPLKPAEKIQHLLGSLPDNISRTFEVVEYSESGFNLIWSELKERFDNKVVLIDKLLSELFKQKFVQKDSPDELRQLLDTYTFNLNQLKLLGQEIEKWDMIIIHLVKFRIDEDLRKSWDRKVLQLRRRNNDDNKLPTWKDMREFLQDHHQVLDQNQFRKKGVNYKTSDSKPIKAFYSAQSFKPERPISCSICQQNHKTFACPELESLKSPLERHDKITGLKLCRNCLRQGHFASSCMNSGTCRHCGDKHHSSICLKQTPSAPEKTNAEEKTLLVQSHHSKLSLTNKEVFLSTAIVNIFDKFGVPRKCRVMLDTGSQSCFITKKLANELQLKQVEVPVDVGVLFKGHFSVNRAVESTVSSRVSNFNTKFEFLVVSEITDVLPNEKVLIDSNVEIPKYIAEMLADPFFNVPARIDLVIGSEKFYDLLLPGYVHLKNTDMKLKETVLGWIMTGSTPLQKPVRVQCNLSTVTMLSDIQKEMRSFLAIESCDVPRRIPTEEDEYCEALFKSTTYRNHEGRFVVTLPVKPNLAELKSNEEVATRRFKYMERKLKNDDEKSLMYAEFLREYESMGHMIKDVDPELTEIEHFLPHHAVLKPDSTTTRLRVVFDASAKSESQLSLNDVLFTGPTVQDDLTSHLLKSRKHKYMVSGDIAKMYRQVLVRPDQTCLQKIKYRRNANEPIINMRLLTLTYGTAPAQFLSTRCLKQLAMDNKLKCPTAADIIERDFSVDDMLTGCNTIEEGRKMLKDIRNILMSAGLPLRKLLSNHQDILMYIPEEDKATIDMNSFTKILGIVWNPSEDSISINLKDLDLKQPVTKRNVLSECVKIYNPPGEFNPVVVKAKIFLQKVFDLKIDWDQELPELLSAEWNSFRSELSDLKFIKIPRFVLIDNCHEVELHGFCDSSEKAYGACIYLRSCNGNNYKSALLFAKSRVAPLHKQTLARLELCAAELLAIICDKVVEVMDIQFKRKFLYSDSTIVLSWLAKHPNSLTTYVGNRVSRIQALTKNCIWSHIKGNDNPADILSRGCTPKELAKSELWWKGPAFLEEAEALWPEMTFKVINDLPEVKPIKMVACVSHTSQTFIDEYMQKSNSTRSLQRLIAFVNRFINNCRLRVKIAKKINHPDEKPRTGVIWASEWSRALKIIVRHVQKREFPDEFSKLENMQEINPKSRLKCLTPFFDQKDQVIRVGGRLKNSDYSFAFKHQMLLPDCKFTKDLLSDLHVEGLHVGQKSLLSIVRHRFWPLRARDKIRQICRGCIKCFKVKPHEVQQFMGHLPKERFVFLHAFLVSGVDCAGPVYIKSGTSRNAPAQKAWIVIFICLATKAIHLELVTDMTTEAFLAALDRFFSTRGLSNKMMSDNGTNFVGSAREFKELQVLLNSEEFRSRIKAHCAEKLVEWVFIPPSAPQFGGIWESAVKLAKYHLSRVLGQALLTYEEYHTVLKKVEAMLNSRPLTPETEDPTDLRVLTPGHFLVGRPLISKPEEFVADIAMYRLTRWRRVQAFNQQLWKRLSEEYIHQLQQKSKNFKHTVILRVGDMVLVKDDSQKVLHWIVGRVTKLYPGNDNIVRVVDVKTASGEYRRPVYKLAKLPLEVQEEEESHQSRPEDVEDQIMC